MGIRLVVDNEAAVKAAEAVVVAAQARLAAAVEWGEQWHCRAVLEDAKRRLGYERAGVVVRKRAAEMGYYT